ncbi:hypothetical protein PQR14_21755 [Paraburkholderia bryophila]|uniref:hypothetical protein n=1 Tax=Burkholderiaceae TaxID=119060 RepID=UPI0018CE1191|nr:hypothetical protein [Burkholderia sp. 9120]
MSNEVLFHSVSRCLLFFLLLNGRVPTAGLSARVMKTVASTHPRPLLRELHGACLKAFRQRAAPSRLRLRIRLDRQDFVITHPNSRVVPASGLRRLDRSSTT